MSKTRVGAMSQCVLLLLNIESFTIQPLGSPAQLLQILGEIHNVRGIVRDNLLSCDLGQRTFSPFKPCEGMVWNPPTNDDGVPAASFTIPQSYSGILFCLDGDGVWLQAPSISNEITGGYRCLLSDLGAACLKIFPTEGNIRLVGDTRMWPNREERLDATAHLCSPWFRVYTVRQKCDAGLSILHIWINVLQLLYIVQIHIFFITWFL